jgi:hypothetical protein
MYIVLEPFHSEIMEVADNVKRSVTDTWETGRFYLEAKIDLFLLV